MLKKVIFFLFIVLNFSLFSGEFDELFNTEENYSVFSVSGKYNFYYAIPYINLENITQPLVESEVNALYTNDKVEIKSNIILKTTDPVIIPGENFIKVDIRNIQFQAGYSIYSWGVADGLNPSDLINEKNMSNLFDIYKIPVISVSLSYFLNNMLFDLVYVPTKNSNVDDFKLGGRISYFSYIDLALNYIWDLDDIKMIGLNLKFTPGIFSVWAESNYSINTNGTNLLEWVTGFDFNFLQDNIGYLNIQTFGTLGSEMTSGLSGKCSMNLMNEEIEVSTKVIYTLPIKNNDNFILFNPEIIYKPIDSLNFNIGAYISDKYHDMDNLYLKVSYSWE
ncbi:MAG: hypothetical protein JXR64_04180 [Spirochaetales bacterium]|nr:hypothetical protein [Spirochaetales bacterium]